MGRWLKTILILIGSAMLTRVIPFSSFFRNLDTMVHETGHALVTLILSGHVMSMELHADHSGVTYSAIASSWSAIPVGLAGYVSASLFSLLMVYLRSKRQQKLGLQLILLVAVITRVLFVHQGFGAFWLIGFIVLTVVVLFLGRTIQNLYYLLLAFLTLEEAVFSPLVLIVLSVTSPGSAGDAAGLSESTGVPAVVWAVLFQLFALWCARAALGYFFRRNEKGINIFGRD